VDRARCAVVAGVVLPVCTLACTLLTGVSGLREVDGGSVDASGDASVEAAKRVDARHFDVVEKDHGSSDARPDVYVDFCATRSPMPTFCSDFDRVPFPWGWDSVQESKGRATLDDHIYLSPPHSLYVTTMPESTGYLYANVQKSFTEPLGDSQLQFDFYLDTVDPDAQYDKLMGLTLAGTSPEWGVFFQLNTATQLGIGTQEPGDGGVDYAGYDLGDAGGTVVLHKWVHVEVDTIKAASGTGIGEFQVMIDGELALPPVPVTSTAAFGPPTLALGLTGSNTPTGPWAVHIDNVTFNMK
jgi:hypothetical protein